MSVTTSGHINTFEVFSEKAALVLGKILETGMQRVLLDDRNLQLELDPLDIARIADQLEKTNRNVVKVRLAALCSEESRHVYRMIETIYRNRSITFQLFEDREGAVAWLLS